MKRTITERDAIASRPHGRSSPSLIDPGVRASLELEGEGEDADRLRALRSARRKRSKPEDWMSGTFHQYDISDVVGAGTFGQVGYCCFAGVRQHSRDQLQRGSQQLGHRARIDGDAMLR